MSNYQDKLPDNGQKHDNGSSAPTWTRYPFGVHLQEDPSEAFNCIKAYEEYVLGGENAKATSEEYSKILSTSVSKDAGTLSGLGFEDQGLASSDPEIKFFENGEYTDSRVGCNDAMNPIWQFNRDDDIRPLMLFPKALAARSTSETGSDDAVEDLSHSYGMGRVYSEMYDDCQQILWLEAGVPRFQNIIEFYRDAADSDVADAINRGTFSSCVIKTVAKFVAGTVWAISLPVLAPFYLSRFLKAIVNDRITKYYSFQPAMTMYYETVNSMLQYTAIAMGMHPMVVDQNEANDGASKNDGEKGIRKVEATSGGTTSATVKKMVKKETKNAEGKVTGYTFELQDVPVVATSDYASYPGVPDVLKNGPDIFKIMNRRARLAGLNNANLSTRDLVEADNQGNNKGNDKFMNAEAYGKYEAKGNKHWSIRDTALNWYGALKGSLLGSGNHIGFRIERGVDASESFNNQTGPTGIAQKLNSTAAQYKEQKESFGNSAAERWASRSAMGAMKGDWGEAGKAIMDEVMKFGLEVGANATGFDIGAVLVTGNGFLDIPEVWRSSTFQKSYSFNIQLRSRYGDPVSIFQSIYIPMFMLLALSAPRAIGTNMYTSPFLVRAYCRGMFSIPLGIVDSITIKRGRDDMGWSNSFLPTAVDISFSIKDLSPTLFLSMQDNGLFDTFSRNSNLLEYLDTLAALGLKERAFWWPKMMRKFNTVLAVSRSTIFSSTYWGTRMGRSTLGRAINTLVPFGMDRQPGN